MEQFPVINLLTSASLLVALGVALDVANSGGPVVTRLRLVIAGAVVGSVGCALMFTHWPVSPGVQIDARSILLACAGLYLGPIPALVAGAIVATVRMGIGGLGTLAGVFAVAISVLAGLAARARRRPEDQRWSAIELAGFGFGTHALVLVSLLALPAPDASAMLALVALPALALGAGATSALGSFLGFRLRQLQAIAARARSEERLDLVLKGSNDAPWDWDIARGSFYYSPRWWALLGYADGELGDDAGLWRRLVHPDDRARVERALRDALAATDSTIELDYRLRHKDGHYVPVAARALVIRDAQGQPIRMSGVSSDLTERDRAARALRQSDERLRRMLAASPDLVITTDLAGRITYVPAIGNRPPVDAPLRATLGCNVVESVAPQDRERALDHLARLAAGESVGLAEYTLVGATGEPLYVEVNADVLRADGGKPDGIFLILRDISRRREAESALRLSEARLRSIAENAPDTVVELDRTGGIRYLSRALPGFPPADGARRDFCLWAPAEFHPTMRAALAQVFADGNPAAFESPAAGVTGETRWYASRLAPVIVDGVVTSAILATRDITERRAADEALRERERTYRAILATAQDGFWMTDLAGRLLDVNDAYARMSGYTRNELLASTIDVLDIGDETAARIDRIVAIGSDRFDSRHRRKDGSSFAAAVHASYSAQGGGRLFVFVRDVSARRRSEGLLQARVELSALALAGTLDEVLRAALDAAERLTGSTLSYFLSIGADGQSVALWSASTATVAGAAGAGGLRRPGTLAQAGIATASLSQRGPVIDNRGPGAGGRPGFAADPQALQRSMTVPVLRGECVVALVCLGNKPESYSDDDAALVGEFASMAMDIVERKRGEERLRQAAAVFDNTGEGVMITDADERILMVNRAFCGLTGYVEAEVLGRTPTLLRSGRHDKRFYADLRRALAASGHWQGEIWNRRKSGEVFPELLSISSVTGDNGKLTHYVGVFADISRLKDSEAKLEHLAHHDPLTGLPNRLLMLQRLRHGIEGAKRTGKDLALLMLDLDRFKDVNDSFGHLAGDDLLQQVARRLATRLRGADTVTRMGGDEFTVLLEGLNQPADAARVARDLVALLSEPFSLDGGVDVRIGASVGISLFPEHADSPELLLQQADTALYRAKDDGRGCFRFYSDDLTCAARERIELEASLRRALERGELRVFYQPLVDVDSDRIVGAEALLRWQNPAEGLIAPGRFIPVAEETGLIVPMGEWVLGEVCRQGRAWMDAGLPALTLAVNLSPWQFCHADVGALVAGALASSGFPAERLELELTETALMKREDDAVAVLIRLRALGVRLAIDDFGTGYSSLAHLKRFPIDVLKIDQRFVEDIADSDGDREIAATVIAMGHTLGYKVLAEGVETAPQLAFLRRLGCDLYQGYLRSPAVPAEEFELLV